VLLDFNAFAEGISMNFFTVENGKLIFENNGETLQIEAWVKIVYVSAPE
jgi:hypothetical protein